MHFMGQPLVIVPLLWILSIRESHFSWSLYSTLVKPLEAMDEDVMKIDLEGIHLELSCA